MRRLLTAPMVLVVLGGVAGCGSSGSTATSEERQAATTHAALEETSAASAAQELGRAEERERIRTNPENLPPEEAREANREREEKSDAESAGISARAVAACSEYGLAGYKKKCEQRWQAEANAGRTPAPEKPNPDGDAAETEEAERACAAGSGCAERSRPGR